MDALRCAQRAAGEGDALQQSFCIDDVVVVAGKDFVRGRRVLRRTKLGTLSP